MLKRILKRSSLVYFIFLPLLGCDTQSTIGYLQTTPAAIAATRYLWVSSGSCYGGGVTTSTGSGIISKYSLSTGKLEGVVLDYNSFSPGDYPMSVAEYDSDNILVLVENTSGRRVDLVKKDGSNVSTWLSNATALNGAVRSMLRLSDGSLLISKSTGIEKFSSSKARITQGANSYVSNPGSSCSASATLISGIGLLGNGNILYAHAGATPNNRIGVISSTGYASTSDCLAAQTGPTTTALPSTVLLHSSGHLIVGYGSTTTASNFVYAYNVDSTTNAISNETAAFSDPAVINGPSAMVEDSTTGEVFIANGTSSFNNIERFSYSSATKTLTRVGTTNFIGGSVYTRCVSGMTIMGAN